MKKVIIFGMLAATVLLTGWGWGNGDDDLVVKTKEEAAQPQVVVGYATVDASNTTNVFFTVTEIWKGSEAGSILGITNGAQYPATGYQSAGEPYEGAIFLFTVITNPIIPQGNICLMPRQEFINVRSGLVGHMTVKEFKAKIGL